MSLDVSAPYMLEYFGVPDYTNTANPLDGITAVDITLHVQTLDKITRSGTGEINSAKVMLDSRFGAFVTDDNGGDTPIISAWDLFRLTVGTADDDKYIRYLVADDRSPQKGEGANLPVELFGLERYLQTMYFLGLYQNVRITDLITMIISHYNRNRGTAQPLLAWSTTSRDNIPVHAWGTFEFGNQTTVYEALMAVIKRLGLSVAVGGGGQQYSLFFAPDLSGVPSLQMSILPQGYKFGNPTNIIVDDADVTLSNPRSFTRVQSPAEGTIIVVEGKPGSGSYPVEPALYNSLIEEFINIPEWVTQHPYMSDTYARYNNKMYQSNKDIDTSVMTAAPPDQATSDWDEITFAEFVAAEHGDIVISPWTHNKAEEWKVMGNNGAFTDTNLVIRDSAAGENISGWRDWVDYKVASLDDIPDTAKYGDEDYYDGFRILYTGTTIDNSTTDSRGLTYENALCMYMDDKWIVIREPERFDECAVTSERVIYGYNKSSLDVPQGNIRKYGRWNVSNLGNNAGVEWRSPPADSYLPNDCFHHYTSIENVDGLLGADPNGLITDVSSFTDNSAIKITYTSVQNTTVNRIANSFVPLLGPAVELYKFLTGEKTVTTPEPDDDNPVEDDDADTQEFLKSDKHDRMGWWCTLFEAPFPKKKISASKPLGHLFGGTQDQKRPLLHFQNLVQTPSGETGYSIDDSESLGPLDKIRFHFNFFMVHRDGDTEVRIPYIGEVPFQLTAYDIFGTKWVASHTVRILGNHELVTIPFSAFRVARSRVQPTRQIANFIYRAINPELKITDVFDVRFCKRINFQAQIAYDDQDRYDPWSFQVVIAKFFQDLVGDVSYEGTIDMLHFTKTPVAIAKDVTELAKRHIMPPVKKYPGVTNVRQLQKIAQAELDITKFQKDEWTYTHEGFLDVEVGSTVYVQDTDYIEEDSDGNDNHTRKYIIKKVTYTVGDRTTSSAFTTTMELFRRLGGYS